MLLELPRRRASLLPPLNENPTILRTVTQTNEALIVPKKNSGFFGQKFFNLIFLSNNPGLSSYALATSNPQGNKLNTI